MLQKFNLSPNKRDFPAPYTGVQLKCEEVFQAAQYFAKKKKIRIYVQSYMPGNKDNHATHSVDQDILQIQDELGENEYAGYLHTEGARGIQIAHVECLIITKTRIIKPVVWSVSCGFINIKPYKTAASADLFQLTQESIIPQADGHTCASLSLVYLKQLLKEDAKQLKELTFIFPYFEHYSLRYFFIPSPQVLRYSQSSAYNKYIKALVMEDEPGSFPHNNKELSFIPIKHRLQQNKARLEGQLELCEEINSLLEQLPLFRKRWQEAYEQMDINRSLMQRQFFNRGLAYTSIRMRKIAVINHEQQYNPGLSLLKEITEQKNNSLLSEEELLTFFSKPLAKLKFQSTTQLAYFLNKLGDLIDSKIIYPFFFSFENKLSLIKTTDTYKECLFILNTAQRQNLNAYFKSIEQFKRLKHSYNEVLSILSWLNSLAIEEQEKITFLKERVPKNEFAPHLLNFLVNYRTDYFDSYFAKEETLVAFFKEYIDKEFLISQFPAILKVNGGISHLELMFSTKTEFYDFIDEHLPVNKMLSYLKGHESFLLGTRAYFTCIAPCKRASVLLKELNDFSSELFQRLCAEKQHPRWLLESLNEFCNETEIATYLTKHRDFLLKAMMLNTTIYPLNLRGKLHNAACSIQFFSCDNKEIIALYQHTFSDCKNKTQISCLKDILHMLPSNTRWDFLQEIFAKQEKNPFLSLAEKPEQLELVIKEENTESRLRPA